MQLGIVGLPNAGKSTLFNALTQAAVETDKYPFTTIEPNVGVVKVPDSRLDAIGEVLGVPERVPATIRFVDIAGLVRGASEGQGLGNQFLAQIREVDAIIHVVRLFEEETVSHVEGRVDPRRDLELVYLEMALVDLATVERRLAEAERRAKTGDERYRRQVDLLQRLHAVLAAGEPARTVVTAREDEQALLRDLHLLTAKRELVLVNVAESEAGLDPPADVVAWARTNEAQVVVLAASLEAELAQLAPNERAAFRQEWGLSESGLARLIRASYRLLDLVTYYTANEQEVRARPIKRAAPVTEAAGRIHSDMEAGFIRADVLAASDLLAVGSQAEARRLGRIRSEGKGYRIQDGDIIYIHFQTS